MKAFKNIFFTSVQATIKPTEKLKTAGKKVIKETCTFTIGIKHIQVNVNYIFLSNYKLLHIGNGRLSNFFDCRSETILTMI